MLLESGSTNREKGIPSPEQLPFVSRIRAGLRMMANWCLFGDEVDPFRRAAVIYFIYGAIYFLGAIVQLTSERKVQFFGFVPWWVFYVLGAIVMVGFPLLVWNRLKWFTRILVFGPLIKAGTLAARELPAELAGGSINPFPWIFFLAAIWATAHIFYAGWRDLCVRTRLER